MDPKSADTLAAKWLRPDPDYDELIVLSDAGNRSYKISGIWYGDEQYKNQFLSTLEVDCTKSLRIYVERNKTVVYGG